MAEIDSNKQNASIVFYEIQNFSPDSGNNVQELGRIMDALKQSKKYRLMTVSQYLETLPSANRARANPMQQPGWNIFLGAIALFVVWRYLSDDNLILVIGARLGRITEANAAFAKAKELEYKNYSSSKYV